MCKEKITILCLKYISDGADGNAVDDWSTEVKKQPKTQRNPSKIENPRVIRGLSHYNSKNYILLEHLCFRVQI